MRYQIHDHPAFPRPLSREDLHLLYERGSLARGDLCRDLQTGRDHLLGELISGMRPPAGHTQPRIGRPSYVEIRADSPYEDNPVIPTSVHQPQDVTKETAPAEADADADSEEEEEAEPEYTDEGERIIYHTHPSWLRYWKSLLLTFLLLITAGLLSYRSEMEFAFVAVLLSIAVLTLTAISRMTRDYYITEERVELVWGILGRSSKEVRICDLRSMDVYESGLKGLLGLGTLDFSSAANAGIEVQFQDIRQAHDVKHLVRELQKEADE